MWSRVVRPTSVAEALEALAREGAAARIVAGGTDVLVELQRGVKPTATLIDVSALRELKYVRRDGGDIALGGLATHNDVLAAPFAREALLPLAQACLEVGAPQIRTRGTIAGNLVTASPANDTIAPLIALDAELVLASRVGERTWRSPSSITGFRRTRLRPDELVREIRVRRVRRRATRHLPQARAAARAGDLGDRRRAGRQLEATASCATRGSRWAVSRRPSSALVAPSASDRQAARCGDLRRGRARRVRRRRADRRRARFGGLSARDAGGADRPRAERIADGREADGFPAAPVLLQTPGDRAARACVRGTIETTINGAPRTLHGAQHKTLLDALRENAGLTGAKEGCAEGECGACTVWLDGAAVMSCLVPATQAHGGAVTTIEGLAHGEALHPLQQAYIDAGAVQCGFCIPGMIMAGAKLLDERLLPSLDDHQAAISGNICRCTGYRKILDAMDERRARCAPASRTGRGPA